MFNLLRLFRRKDHIDDTAAAYIEGRATERDQAELRERAVREPDLFGDLDSIRDTVSLLRTVEPVAAPRSFALAEAPVQVRVKRSRMAMAPAVFAIAAATLVGLLAVGNLADVVRQNDDSSFSVTNGSSSEDSVTLSRDSAASQTESAASIGGLEGAPEQGGDAEIAGGAGTSDDAGSSVVIEPDESARAAASPTPDSANATSSLPPSSAITVDGTAPAGDATGSDGALAPLAPGFETQPATGSESSDAVPPSIAPGQEIPEDEAAAGSELKDNDAEPMGPTPNEPMPLPESTVTGLFDLSQTLELDAADQPLAARADDDEPSGFALPLWQLQIVFASIAVLMAGAWMALQRRLTS